MSRSRKKVPGFTDSNPWAKQAANKKVRRTLDVPNGKAYRKVFCSYNICDCTYLLFSKTEIKRYLEVTNQTFNKAYKTYTK